MRHAGGSVARRRARLATVVAALAGLSLAFATTASAQHQDALVFEESGRVQMGLMDVDCFSGVGTPGCSPYGTRARVFEAELEENGTSPGLFGQADEPGFFSVPDGGESFLPFGGDNLPGNAAHSIDLTLAPNSPVPGASILYWDGLGGTVNWSAVPNNEYFEVLGNSGTGGFMTATSVLSGIELDSTSASGSFDTHPEYYLHGNGGVDDATTGFYAIFGTTNVAGLLGSHAWGVVFDFGVEDEEAHEMAVGSLATVVPEPGTGLLVGLGLTGLAIRRRTRA